MNDNYSAQTYRYRRNNSRHEKFSNDDNDSRSRYESLKEAVLQKDRGTIIWLLNEGCPLNDPSSDKNTECTPLHNAVYANDLDIARLLISAGAQVSVANVHKQTPLHLAFELSNTRMVDLLLSECDGKLNPFTVYGLSHFHIACVRNNWRVANAFLERGVNANTYLEKCFYAKDYVYYRPLHLAVEYENLEVTELLLKYGANVNAKDRYKRTPLHLACRYNWQRISQAIRSAEDVDTPGDAMQLVKSENNQLGMVKLLIRYRADVNALDSNGTPPMFHVFKWHYREVREAIAERLQIEDEHLWEEVARVLSDLQREKFYVLMQCDADLKFCNEFKESLLHLVIDGRKLFGNCGVSSKERDLDDAEKSEIVDLLLKYGAEVDARNASGQTPLQLAISSYYVETVKALLNNYAAVSGVCFFHYKIPKRDTSGNFNLREMENFLDIVALVLRRKADLNMNCSNELLMLRYMSMESSVQHFENCSTADLRHLLDFGDINTMNMSFYASERSVLSNREKISLVVEHIKKLQVAGLYVDKSITREFIKCDRIMNAGQGACARRSFVDRCEDEIRRLKITMIDRYASFYDLLFMNVNEVAVRMKNSEFRRSIRINCDDKLTLYSAMIIKQFVKGLLRSILLESTKEYLSFIIDFELPDPCSESILSHLKNEDLCNLALAFQ